MLGWHTNGSFSTETGVMHYVYVWPFHSCPFLYSVYLTHNYYSLQTLPPVAVAAFVRMFCLLTNLGLMISKLVAMWTWTDIEIKKMQVSQTFAILRFDIVVDVVLISPMWTLYTGILHPIVVFC